MNKTKNPTQRRKGAKMIKKSRGFCNEAILHNHSPSPSATALKYMDVRMPRKGRTPEAAMRYPTSCIHALAPLSRKREREVFTHIIKNFCFSPRLCVRFLYFLSQKLLPNNNPARPCRPADSLQIGILDHIRLQISNRGLIPVATFVAQDTTQNLTRRTLEFQ